MAQTQCTCDSGCQYCDTCTKCDNYSETLCSLNGQTYADTNGYSFSWGNAVKKDAIIGPGYFDKDDWAEIITYINDARKAGKHSSTGGTLNSATTANLKPFTAKEYNRIADAIKVSNVSKGQLITASLFHALEDGASSRNISSSACDVCNTDCQQCNTGCQANTKVTTTCD